MLIKHKDIEARVFDAVPEHISEMSDRSATARLVESIAILQHVTDPVVKAENLATSILLFRRLYARLLQEDEDLLELTLELLKAGGDRRVFSRPTAHRRNSRTHFSYKIAEGGTCRTTITKIYSPIMMRGSSSETKDCEEKLTEG